MAVGWHASECVHHVGAAKTVSQGESTDVAAIASRRAAELYGLEILDSGIQDKADNYTRFIVLSRYVCTQPAHPGGYPGPEGSSSPAALSLVSTHAAQDKNASYSFMIGTPGQAQLC